MSASIKIDAVIALAKKFGKDQLVVWAWDEKTNQINIVAVGNTDADADDAAAFSRHVLNLLGFKQGLNENHLNPRATSIRIKPVECPACAGTGKTTRPDALDANQTV